MKFIIFLSLQWITQLVAADVEFQSTIKVISRKPCCTTVNPVTACCSDPCCNNPTVKITTCCKQNPSSTQSINQPAVTPVYHPALPPSLSVPRPVPHVYHPPPVYHPRPVVRPKPHIYRPVSPTYHPASPPYRHPVRPLYHPAPPPYHPAQPTYHPAPPPYHPPPPPYHPPPPPYHPIPPYHPCHPHRCWYPPPPHLRKKSPVKPGMCPAGLHGPCVESCQTDYQCPGHQKCCFTGCGHACIPSVGLKPGVCPRPTGLGHCADLCTSDSECPGISKCCSNGCGHECETPVQVRRPKPGVCPIHPPAAGPCEDLCGSDAECPGSQKCCSNICGHTCLDPTSVHTGVCPKPFVKGPCHTACHTDGHCSVDHKCCSTGCGHSCKRPIVIVHPTTAPVTNHTVHPLIDPEYNEFLNDALQAHNDKRKIHGACALGLNQTLSDLSQEFARKVANMGILIHSQDYERPGQGENVAFACDNKPSYTLSGKKMTEFWYNEMYQPGYDFVRNGLQPGTEHFTQVVWKGTKQVGFGRVNYKFNMTHWCSIGVARYSPAGNIIGLYHHNVMPCSTYNCNNIHY